MQKEALAALLPGITNLFLLPGKDLRHISSLSNGFYVTDMIGSSVSMAVAIITVVLVVFGLKMVNYQPPLQKQL